jgi:hypothetical protein
MTEPNDPCPEPIEPAPQPGDASNAARAGNIAMAGEAALRAEAIAAGLEVAAAVAPRHIATLIHLHRSAIARGKTAWGLINHYERPLSALGMVTGFAFDNYTYRRIDLPNTQILFIAYLVVSASGIALLHLFSRRARDGKPMPRWHSLLPIATQFALGGLWSAFLVFYSRGSVLTASWPFLLVLVAILIGNEIFKEYYSRLAFTSILFFFALYSWCIVTLPILTGTIGMLTFIASGIAALLLFSLFAGLLRNIGREQWNETRWWIALGTISVFGVLNLFYFTDILPPLPLALASGGVYHTVTKTAKGYVVVAEPQNWKERLGATPVLHVKAGESLSVYSAVFAPISLSTRIAHLWQRYDPVRGEWLTVSKVTYAIHGGRDEGYRGYTIHHAIAPGEWRVDVDTLDNRTIGRIRFNVERASAPVVTARQTLG